jgi:FtsH-binding integral membrane protein
MGVSVPTGSLVRTGEERATLVRRTYSLVFVSVLVTIFGASFGLSQPSLMQMVAQHPFLTFIAVIAPMFLATRTRQQFPANIGFVLLFTFIEGIWISPILYVYGRTQPGLITQAAGLTIGAFGILTIYAFVSRRDFSAWGSFLIVGLFVLIGTYVLNFFFRNQSADLWLASVTVLLFSGLLVFDTWRLRNVYGPDDYVQAAVNIYLDLLNMFLALIRILGGRRS